MNHDRAIILAAGASRRMGSSKLTLPFGSATIIETVIRNIRMAGLNDLYVVLGHHREAVRASIDQLPVHTCINEDPDKGMLSSVQAGFRALPDNSDAVCVFPGDQPGIPVNVIRSLVNAFHASDLGMAVPVFGTKRGHPLVVDYRYREEVERLDPGTGLRGLLQKFPEDLLEVNVQDRGILIDIDTRTDYKNAKKILQDE